MLIMSEGDTWKKVRRLLSRYFFSSMGSSLYDVAQFKTTEYIESLSSRSGEIVSLKKDLRFLVSDIYITNSFGQLPREVVELLIQTVINYSEYQATALQFGPDVVFTLDLIKRYRSSLQSSQAILGDLLDNYAGEDPERPKLIDGIHRGIQTGEISREAGIFEMLGILVAIVEPTFAGLSSTLYALEINLSAKERLLGEMTASGLRHQILSYDYINGARWLDACIKESLRCRPPVWAIIRETAQEDTFESAVLPAGMRIIISPETLHHHEAYWPNPNSFRPERFLMPELATHFQNSWIPFYSGTHACIGQLQGMVLLKTIAAMFAQKTVWTGVPLDVNYDLGTVRVLSDDSMNWQLKAVHT